MSPTVNLNPTNVMMIQSTLTYSGTNVKSTLPHEAKKLVMKYKTLFSNELPKELPLSAQSSTESI